MGGIVVRGRTWKEEVSEGGRTWKPLCGFRGNYFLGIDCRRIERTAECGDETIGNSWNFWNLKDYIENEVEIPL